MEHAGNWRGQSGLEGRITTIGTNAGQLFVDTHEGVTARAADKVPAALRAGIAGSGGLNHSYFASLE
jgi:hypothetical protein